jgi:hypothetical protein
MASKDKKRSSSALDPMMAGFAAGAAAFIIYAMPQARFDEAVSLSGLPMILSAAQPPLGMTARFAAMAAAGIGSFLLVWLVLRALSKPAPKPKHRSGPVEIEMAPPRLRRADAHPDAPSRRPILAGVDLGRPFDEMPVGEQDSFDQVPGEEDQPLDTLLAAEEQPWDSSPDDKDRETHELPAQGDHYADQYVDPYQAEHYVDPYQAHHYVDPYQAAHEPQAAGDLPAFEEEAEQAEEWLPLRNVHFDEAGFDEVDSDDPGHDGAGSDEPGHDDRSNDRFGVDGPGFDERRIEPEYEERAAVAEEQEFAEHHPVASFPVWEEPAQEDHCEEAPLDFSPREVQTVHALSQRLPDAEGDRPASIPHLMERLEAGLRRRQPNPRLPSATAPHSANGTVPGEAPPQLDSRLRGAIQELQKLAARGN